MEYRSAVLWKESPLIEAVLKPSKFVSQAHLQIYLAGQPLDLLIAKFTERADLEGLVTPLDDCLADRSEQELVLQRIRPSEMRTSTVPLLVCPDCLDLCCTVVEAEVKNLVDKMVWARFSIGDEWIAGLGPFTFPMDEYDCFLEDCQGMRTQWWS
jgi:hypothetical protein